MFCKLLNSFQQFLVRELSKCFAQLLGIGSGLFHYLDDDPSEVQAFSLGEHPDELAQLVQLVIGKLLALSEEFFSVALEFGEVGPGNPLQICAKNAGIGESLQVRCVSRSHGFAALTP